MFLLFIAGVNWHMNVRELQKNNTQRQRMVSQHCDLWKVRIVLLDMLISVIDDLDLDTEKVEEMER